MAPSEGAAWGDGAPRRCSEWGPQYWLYYFCTLVSAKQPVFEKENSLFSVTETLFFKILFIHERHREAETQSEGEACSLRGARLGARSQDPGVTP